MVIRGIQRHSQSPRTRNAITYPLLIQILDYLSVDYPSSTHNRLMLSAATSLAFYALLRVSEFTAPSRFTFFPHRTLLVRDAKIQHHTISLRIRASKTDQKRKGQTVLIDCTGTPSCPATLLTRYMTHSQHLRPSVPIFQFKDGSYLTPSRFTAVLKQALTAVGTNPRHFSSHSLRIGGATAAAAAGTEPAIIQELGRWRSQCYRRYLRVPNTRLYRAAKAMSQNTKNTRH